MSASAWWGDIPLAFDDAAELRYVRARGVEASLSTVAFDLGKFGDAASDLTPAPDANRFAKSGEGSKGVALVKAISDILDARKGKAIQAPDGEVSYRADLVVVGEHGFDGDQVHGFVAKSLFLVDAHVALPGFEPKLVQATLADVRWFWDDFGEITRSWNVPLPAAADGSPRWEASTSKDRGTAPTPLKEIVQALLSALPGALPVVRFPDDYASLFPPFVVKCWAASPKEVLSALLVHTGIELDIGPDLRARLFAPGEGEVGQCPTGDVGQDNSEAHDPVTKLGAWQDALLARGDGYLRKRNANAPSEVLVVGGRTEWTIAVDFMVPALVREVLVDLDGTTERQTIEVTPTNLAKLCRGELDPRVDTADEDVGVEAGPPKLDPTGRMVGKLHLSVPVSTALDRLRAGPPSIPVSTPQPPALPDGTPVSEQSGSSLRGTLGEFDVAGDGTISKPAEVLSSLDDPLFWERLVLQPKPWARLLPGVAPDTVQLLERQLMRVYQVPPAFKRCLPILRRAERDKQGRRRAPVLEGFRFTTYEVQVPPVAKVPLDRQKLLEFRDELVGQLGIALEHLDRVRQRRLAEVVKATSDAAKAIADGRGADADESAAAVKAAVEAKLRTALGGLFGVEEFDAEIKITEQGIDAFRKQIAAVDDLLDPCAPITRELGAVCVEIAGYRQGLATVPERLLARERELMEKLKAEQAKRAQAVQIEDEKPRYVTEHVNLPLRTPFPFRVLDADEGLVQVDGDDLPGLLSETTGPIDAGKALLALPVRLIFGTSNERDVLPVTTGGQADHSYYVSRAIALAKVDPELAKLLGPMGDVHPATRELTGLPIGNVLPAGVAGPGQTRFTFTRADQETGQAEVGAHPWRVVEDVKLLVGLDGSSNREEVYKRCAAAARPLLRRPEVGETGSLEVVHPRAVLCNGRISAVEVRYDSSLGNFTTTVSFASDLAPLLGVFGVARDRGAFSGVFGLDVDAREGD